MLYFYEIKIMRVFMFIFLCVVALNFAVSADENEVKPGSFPFMAFLYYTDETILEDGARFTRGAALISNNWLISSGDVAVAFPNKTLLARLGAIDIDQKFTLDEVEDEQEREVILILRPYNYSATEWWKTDISLLKTLLPFNITSAVAAARLTSNLDPIYNNCYILVYSRRSANETDRILTQMDVDLLPPTQEQCGNYFSRETMACAVDSENNSAVVDPNFCQGNRGGPLICDNELIGLQTYINDCKQPHLYQLFIRWNKFINCAAEQRYLTQQCADITIAITKDPPLRTPETPKLTEAVVDILLDKDIPTTTIQQDTEATEKSTITAKVDKPTVTSVVQSKSLETKTEEKQTTKVSSKESYSHDTTANTTATELTHTEKAVMESTKEPERKHRIEAQHHLVRGKASLNLPSLSLSLMVVSILAYT